MLTKRFADARADRAGGARRSGAHVPATETAHNGTHLPRRIAARQGDEFNFLDVGGALSGAFANIEVRNLMPGFQFDVRPDAGGLTMVALNDGVFVPEPATLAMLVAGMLATLFRRQARRSQ